MLVPPSLGEAIDQTTLNPLGGPGVVIRRVISPLIWVISLVTLPITLLITTLHPKPDRTLKEPYRPLITLLITTHEPPSTDP